MMFTRLFVPRGDQGRGPPSGTHQMESSRGWEESVGCAGETKQEVNEWASANRGLMGVWIDRSSDGCVGRFSPNWRCKRVVASRIVSEKRRTPPVAAAKSNLPDGFYWLEWRDSMADGQTQGQRMKGCMHDQFALFQGGFAACGRGGFSLDSGGVIRRAKS